ncbi:multiple sugar-binding protein precursor [Peptococcaceae bacterium CEB3]|nr:multiple sugar-binding protein precursor [Peptococcaceae bacterium CEB3]
MRSHVNTKIMAMASAIVIILSMFLAGCGSSGSTNSPSKVSISYWTWAPAIEIVKKQITAFEKEYPNISVDYKVSTYNDYLVALKAAANAGSLPTVMALQPVGTGVSVSYLRPLQDFAKSSLGQNWQAKYVKTGLQQARMINPPGDNNFYALPEGMQSTSLVVNTAIFHKYKLPVPQTFSELEQDAAVLRSHGVAPILLGGADGWQNEDLFLEIANQVAPDAWYQAEKAGTGFDAPGLVKAMNIWRSLFTEHIVQGGAMGAHAYPDEVNAFNKGEGAIIPLGSWAISSTPPGPYNVPLAKEWQMIQFPKLSATAQQIPLAGADAILGMAKSVSGVQADAGWKLIQFLTQGDGEVIYANEMCDLPAKVGLTPSTLPYASAKVMYQQSVDWTKEGTSRYVANPQLNNALITALASVATGQATPAAALSKLDGVAARKQ